MTEYEIEMALAGGVNLSYWNSGSEYKSGLKRILKYESVQDVFDYQYYPPDFATKPILRKLGFKEECTKCASLSAFSQSTLSIVTIAALLSKRNLKLGIVAPAYFSVQSCCERFKVPHIVFNDFIQDFNVLFDADALLQSDCDAFWFTSPINSTSVYFNQNVKDGIQKLLDCGKLVFLDESLCVNGMELSRTFGIQENLIYIYSPHKALGIQGIKFSAVVAHKKYYAEIDCLKDSFGGALNCSNIQAVAHFTSHNFDECTDFYNTFWQENFKQVQRVLSQYDFAHVSPDVAGNYAMIFVDRRVEDKSFIEAMKVLIKEQDYYIFPGTMQGFETTKRFCFRVNLLLNREDLEKGLTKVLDYFLD